MKLTQLVDSPISGASAQTLSIALLNYNKDFRIKASAKNEVVLVNTTTPLDEEETIRVAYTDIKNIYTASGYSTPLSGQTQGVSVLVQLNKKVKVTPDNTQLAPSYHPVSAHMVLKLPMHEAFDSKVILEIIGRLTGILFENGTSRVNALCKGAINPQGL